MNFGNILNVEPTFPVLSCPGPTGAGVGCVIFYCSKRFVLGRRAGSRPACGLMFQTLVAEIIVLTAFYKQNKEIGKIKDAKHAPKDMAIRITEQVIRPVAQMAL